MVRSRYFTAEIKGRIKPLLFNKDSLPNQIYDLVDWAAIFQKHTPPNALDVQFALQLEYLQCDYLLLSPMKIPAAGYPSFDEILDSPIDRQNKTYEFKRKYNQTTGHANRITLHTKWGTEDYSTPKADELLYNLGQRGYLNLFSPYLLRDADVDFGDVDYKLGAQITNQLGDYDTIEINAGYAGTVSYYKDYETQNLSSRFGYSPVATTATKVVDNRDNRVSLYLSNAGTTRLYFAFLFSVSTDGIQPKLTPFIEPGETASFEFGRITGMHGGSGYFRKEFEQYLIPQEVWAIRESGSGNVGYQEFYY